MARRHAAGLDQVLVKKKSKLELEKEAAAAAPRQAAVKKQTPRVSADADRPIDRRLSATPQRCRCTD